MIQIIEWVIKNPDNAYNKIRISKNELEIGLSVLMQQTGKRELNNYDQSGSKMIQTFHDLRKEFE